MNATTRLRDESTRDLKKKPEESEDAATVLEHVKKQLHSTSRYKQQIAELNQWEAERRRAVASDRETLQLGRRAREREARAKERGSAELLRESGSLSVQKELWCARWSACDLDLLPAYALSPASAEGLHDGFFDRVATGVVASSRAVAGVTILALSLREDLRAEALSGAL